MESLGNFFDHIGTLDPNPRPRLVYCRCETFTKLWEDAGTSSKPYDGAFFRPVPPEHFYILGDVVVGKEPNELKQTWWHRLPIAGTDIDTDVMVVSDPYEAGVMSKLSMGVEEKPLLAPPADFERIWSDDGSGAKCGRMSIWRPLPPPGYRALGYLLTTGKNGKHKEKPDPNIMRCVAVEEIEPGEVEYHHNQRGFIWANSTGYCHDGPVSCWPVGPVSAGFGAGMFVAKRGVGPPSLEEGESSMFVLKS